MNILRKICCCSMYDMLAGYISTNLTYVMYKAAIHLKGKIADSIRPRGQRAKRAGEAARVTRVVVRG